jgi:hypothetical protein
VRAPVPCGQASQRDGPSVQIPPPITTVEFLDVGLAALKAEPQLVVASPAPNNAQLRIARRACQYSQDGSAEAGVRTPEDCANQFRIQLGRLAPLFQGFADRTTASTSTSSSTPRRCRTRFLRSRRLAPVLLLFCRLRSSSARDARITMTTLCNARRRTPARASLSA